MIVNAVVHRNYLDNSAIQVAIYDNRIEVTSPGNIYGGMTLTDVLSGRSKIRNERIAEIFGRMEIAESWGTGIKRIIDYANEHDLPPPEFIEMDSAFRVNFFRRERLIEKADKAEKPIKKVDRKTDKKLSLPDNEPNLPDNKPSLPDNKLNLPDNKSSLPDNEEEIVIFARSTQRLQPKVLQNLILELCKVEYRTKEELADLLNRSEKRMSELLYLLNKEQKLVLRFPNHPNHPRQAYKASQK